MVTVDVRGSWQRWLKARDLTTGATYTFSVQALTVSYGPPIRANLTAQPVQGKHLCVLMRAYFNYRVQFLKQICV